MYDTLSLQQVGAALWRLAWLALTVTGWVVGLTLLFVSTGWPRWAFYVAVIGGTITFAILGAATGSVAGPADS
ncbi:hypothetical protein C479_05063 [Halovivax asiaticus JCM 14624]|uniref:DUF8119 domain-containing protein n=1 Tax=Halovivax asiaticus JCM 14624 TaxID=1227490 RepID=M0BMR5_9EURY|nr:hypothetical protein [Halovivax asiaticus]ELZ12150.1 hypothetical protein C479_05063 [Halovivax asiaticus JCM 14624]